MDFMTCHRMKVLAFALLYLLGCNTPDVPDVPVPDQAIEIKAPGFNDDQDIFAFTLAQNTEAPIGPVIPTPGPTPNGPKVGDKCENCNGTGKVGDGTVFVQCSDCKGDGVLHAGDPGLPSSSQEKEEEHSVVVEYARQDAFDQLVSETNEGLEILESETKVKYDALVTQLNENNTALQAKFDEVKASVDALNGRISQLEAELKALDEECTCDEAPQPPSVETPKIGYRIQYNGETYIWQGEGVFQNREGWKISYPHLKDADGAFLEANPDVRICPEGEVCVETKIEKYDSSNDLPLIKSIPKTEPSTSKAPQTFYDPYYPVRPSYTWWSGCNSYSHLLRGEHVGKFDSTWLYALDWPELQSLHSDDHDGRVKWKYVMR